jgi:hypothetical protein
MSDRVGGYHSMSLEGFKKSKEYKKLQKNKI